jgi:hypothetical protein
MHTPISRVLYRLRRSDDDLTTRDIRDRKNVAAFTVLMIFDKSPLQCGTSQIRIVSILVRIISGFVLFASPCKRPDSQ